MRDYVESLFFRKSNLTSSNSFIISDPLSQGLMSESQEDLKEKE